jgi:hypothetical protein
VLSRLEKFSIQRQRYLVLIYVVGIQFDRMLGPFVGKTLVTSHRKWAGGNEDHWRAIFPFCRFDSRLLTVFPRRRRAGRDRHRSYGKQGKRPQNETTFSHSSSVLRRDCGSQTIE